MSQGFLIWTEVHPILVGAGCLALGYVFGWHCRSVIFLLSFKFLQFLTRFGRFFKWFFATYSVWYILNSFWHFCVSNPMLTCSFSSHEFSLLVIGLNLCLKFHCCRSVSEIPADVPPASDDVCCAQSQSNTYFEDLERPCKCCVSAPAQLDGNGKKAIKFTRSPYLVSS